MTDSHALTRSTLMLTARLGLAVALALTQIGCGQPPTSVADSTASLQVEAEFAEYVARFEQSSTEHGKTTPVSNLIVRFGEVDASADSGEAQGRGVCEWAGGLTPVVTISREAWDASTEAEREELIFHELGHCVLGLRHEAGINSDGIPQSIMNPTKIDGAIYAQNRDFYLKGLFSKKR